MSIKEKISADRIAAMKSKNDVIKNITTTIVSEAKNLGIANKSLSEDECVKQAVKSWNKKLTEFVNDSKIPEESKLTVREELNYLSQFVEKTASEEETKKLVLDLIASHGANLGLVMRNIPKEPVYDKALVKTIFEQLKDKV